MAIFYMKTNIIGRSSGRSSVGAAAYRAGEKLRSVAHASYQSGEKLQGNLNSPAESVASGVRNKKPELAQSHAAKDDKKSKITHDYRSKGGVVHKEIILPENAPPEYADRETLWNAVEASETRKNSQLAREIIVALPKEFNLDEHIDILRAYSQENFVKIGMIADFAIHDNGDGNPHAHIMLTTRHVTRDGFGGKNRDWNKKEFLLSYRAAWANIINSMLVRKGLDVRIDHRSYKEQGVDRLPYIHLGHEAAALEKKGVRTAKGDYNREIQQINETRAALNAAKYKLLQEKWEAQKTAQQETEKITLAETGAGEQTESEKPSQILEKMQTPHIEYLPEIQKTELYINELQGTHTLLKKELSMLERQDNQCRQKIMKIDNRAETLDEDDANIKTLQGRITELKAERPKLHIWQIRRKRKIDKELRQLEKDLQAAEYDFGKKYLISHGRAHVEMGHILEEKSKKREELEKIKVRAAQIDKDMTALETEQRKQKRRKETLPDDSQTFKLPKNYKIFSPEERREIIQQIQTKQDLDTLKRNAVIMEKALTELVESLHKCLTRKKKRSISR